MEQDEHEIWQNDCDFSGGVDFLEWSMNTIVPSAADMVASQLPSPLDIPEERAVKLFYGPKAPASFPADTQALFPTFRSCATAMVCRGSALYVTLPLFGTQTWAILSLLPMNGRDGAGMRTDIFVFRSHAAV